MTLRINLNILLKLKFLIHIQAMHTFQKPYHSNIFYWEYYVHCTYPLHKKGKKEKISLKKGTFSGGVYVHVFVYFNETIV